MFFKKNKKQTKKENLKKNLELIKQETKKKQQH